MRNFFQSSGASWSQRTDKLHVYVLPDAAVHEHAALYNNALHDFPAISVMPSASLHMTVQKIDRYLHEVDDAHIARLVDALTCDTSTLAPFSVAMRLPYVQEYGVGLDGELPATEFFDLLARVRHAITSVFGQDSVAPVPATWGPHITLGYGIGEADSAPLVKALAEVADARIKVAVDAVHLLSVSQHPHEGIFTWDPLATISLRG